MSFTRPVYSKSSWIATVAMWRSLRGFWRHSIAIREGVKKRFFYTFPYCIAVSSKSSQGAPHSHSGYSWWLRLHWSSERHCYFENWYQRFLFPSILINGLNLFFFFSGTSEPVWFPPCLSSFQWAKFWWNGWNSGRWSYVIYPNNNLFLLWRMGADWGTQ